MRAADIVYSSPSRRTASRRAGQKRSRPTSRQGIATVIHRTSVLVAAFLEGGPALGRRLALVLRLPFLVGHAVDDLAALVLAQRHALGIGRVLHPVGQAVAAEARKI